LVDLSDYKPIIFNGSYFFSANRTIRVNFLDLKIDHPTPDAFFAENMFALSGLRLFKDFVANWTFEAVYAFPFSILHLPTKILIVIKVQNPGKLNL